MMRFVLNLIVLCVIGSASLAKAPDSSLRPVPRGTVEIQDEAPALAQVRPAARPAVLEAALAESLARQLRVEARPGFAPEPAEVAETRALAFAAMSPQATRLSLRPALRPGAIVEKAMARQRERRRGAVCGDRDIQGEHVGFVPGRIRGCGIDDAVRVRSVNGIPLSQQALVDCRTAKALKTWVDKGLKRSIGRRGGGVARIEVAAHYACRTRNNQPGGKISEHGRGRAIDISAVVLKNGQRITVLTDWDRGRNGRALRQMHRAACGPFGTVLGPDSDRFHRDHFHFDTARYRSGAYCR
ncbi:extensin family protein [Aestuariicoccus sp. MJ-SS9]|uniref:extensin-like domain-containing protein n=1 Tax=Aestuariicoccus sp. MJ-SS9 TaxID=3079855 RepID=UPI0029066FE4|nr:extensin family protein [Aestuariicoccus sp. MJ-SS9]MDU8910771.1 extensin family protein [Aestuariicoccus sp. MJ-SS9]